MGPLTACLAAFASRRATLFVGLSCGIGLVFQDLAALARPTLGVLVFALMALAFLQVEPADLARRLRRPARAVAAVAVICLALPVLVLGTATLLGVPERDPALMLMLFLVTAPTPLISAPTLAAMMGLDGSLILAVVLVAQATVPFTAPAIAALFVGPDLPLSVGDLALRLGSLVAFAFLASVAVRRLVGTARVRAAKPGFDVAAVLLVVWFGVAAMDGLRGAIAAAPLEMLALLALAWGVALVQMGLAFLLFRPVFGAEAVPIAYAAGNRNIGLLVAAIGVMALPDRVWFFFALAQLPIFTIPFLMKGLAARLLRAADTPAGRP